MCYGPKMSASLFIVGLATAAYVIIYNPKLRKTYIPMILLFYAGMELLQTVQYFVVNKCDDKLNYITTEIAYLLVIAQPLLWNFYFYLNSSPCEKNIFKAAMLFAICWIMLNVASRVSHTPQNALDKTSSLLAGDQVCTKQKAYHLYWEWTFANLGNFNANFVMYLLIWFVPALVSSQYMVSIILILSALVSGVFVTMLKEPFTFTSAWCYFSIPIVILVVLHSILYKA